MLIISPPRAQQGPDGLVSNFRSHGTAKMGNQVAQRG